MLRRTVLGSLALGLGVLCLLPAWVLINAQDLPEFEADLGVEPSFDHTDWSGFRAAFDRSGVGEDGDEERLIRGAWDRPEELAWLTRKLESAAPAYAALEAVLESPGLSPPPAPEDLLASGWSDLLLSVQQLVRLSSASARAEGLEASTSVRIERALYGQRVGAKFANASEIDLIVLMHGFAWQTMSLTALRSVLESEPLGAPEASRLIARLESWRTDASAWKVAWATEYRFFEAGLPRNMDWEEAETPLALLPRGYAWQRNRTLSAAAEVYRRYQADAELNCATLLERPRSAREESRWRLLVTPNPIGEVLVGIVQRDNYRFELRRCHAATQVSALQAAVAVKAYRESTGGVPGSLARLVPAFLPSVPVDDYTGRPIEYSASDGRVFSTSAELAKAHGVPVSEEQLSLRF